MRPSEEGYDSAFRDHHTIVTCTGNLWKGWLPLYTAPPAAQPVQEPETFERWNAKQHGDPEEIGFLQALRIAYCAGQNSVTTPPLPVQRQWVGLTKQDMPSGENPMFDHKYFCAGMVYAAKVLQDKNHG
jgi:hypothetical protein